MHSNSKCSHWSPVFLPSTRLSYLDSFTINVLETQFLLGQLQIPSCQGAWSVLSHTICTWNLSVISSRLVKKSKNGAQQISLIADTQCASLIANKVSRRWCAYVWRECEMGSNNNNYSERLNKNGRVRLLDLVGPPEELWTLSLG